MIGDKELHSLLDLPAEERLKLARILIESAAEDAPGDSSNQTGGEKTVSTNSWLSLAGRYAGGPGDTFVLIRGAYDHPGEKVGAGTPAILPPLPPGVAAWDIGTRTCSIRRGIRVPPLAGGPR